MGKLIIISGGSGAGKSYLLKNLDFLNGKLICNYDATKSTGKYVAIPKLTTRSRRNEDDDEIDLIYDCDMNSPKNRKRWLACGKFIYPYGNYYYGIQCDLIDEELRKGNNPIVIVRDLIVLQALKDKYDLVIDIYVSSSLSESALRKKFLDNPNSIVTEIDERINNIKHDKNQLYYCRNEFYRIVKNYYNDKFLEEIYEILKHSPDVIQNQIAIIANSAERIRLIADACEGAGFKIETINSNDFDYHVGFESEQQYLERREKEIDKIKESHYIFFDITANKNENKSGLYRLLSVVESKNKVENIVILSEKNNIIPFDIYNHKRCDYDQENGNLWNIVRNQIELIFKSQN